MHLQRIIIVFHYGTKPFLFFFFFSLVQDGGAYGRFFSTICMSSNLISLVGQNVDYEVRYLRILGSAAEILYLCRNRLEYLSLEPGAEAC